MTVMRTYKYKLYNSKQNKRLHAAIDTAAEIWNYCIAVQRRYYKLFGKYIPANVFKKHITKLKRRKRYTHWCSLGSQAVQDVVERVDRAYNAFFTHVREHRSGRKSPPHFCKKKAYKSFTLKQTGYKFLGSNRVTIMGHDYKYTNYRPFEGDIATVTIKRNVLGELFLYVVCRIEAPLVAVRSGKTAGFDFGLKNFLTCDDGSVITSPEFLKRDMAAIRRLQRNLSSKQKGSSNRGRAKASLAREHESVSNRRRDWFYKTAKYLAEQYSVICIEDLNIKGMQKLWGRKISDIAFAEFVEILGHQCSKTGSKLVKIDRFAPSSKMCSSCGAYYGSLTLDEREWTCSSCGIHHDRDINAAINIKAIGLASI